MLYYTKISLSLSISDCRLTPLHAKNHFAIHEMNNYEPAIVLVNFSDFVLSDFEKLNYQKDFTLTISMYSRLNYIII